MEKEVKALARPRPRNQVREGASSSPHATIKPPGDRAQPAARCPGHPLALACRAVRQPPAPAAAHRPRQSHKAAGPAAQPGLPAPAAASLPTRPTPRIAHVLHPQAHPAGSHAQPADDGGAPRGLASQLASQPTQRQARGGHQAGQRQAPAPAPALHAVAQRDLYSRGCRVTAECSLSCNAMMQTCRSLTCRPRWPCPSRTACRTASCLRWP